MRGTFKAIILSTALTAQAIAPVMAQAQTRPVQQDRPVPLPRPVPDRPVPLPQPFPAARRSSHRGPIQAVRKSSRRGPTPAVPRSSRHGPIPVIPVMIGIAAMRDGLSVNRAATG